MPLRNAGSMWKEDISELVWERYGESSTSADQIDHRPGTRTVVRCGFVSGQTQGRFYISGLLGMAVLRKYFICTE